MVQVLRCCGCGSDPAAAAPIQPLAWEFPHTAGELYKSKKKKGLLIFVVVDYKLVQKIYSDCKQKKLQ